MTIFSSIPHVLKTVAETKGTNAKVDMLAGALRQNMDGSLLHILTISYNPFITFGVDDTKKIWNDYQITSAYLSGKEVINSKVFLTLEDMATRKVTGNAAKEALVGCLESNNISAEQAEIVMLILRKDLRIGMATTLINKAIEAAGIDNKFKIPTYECQLAHKFEPKRMSATGYYIAEDKLDGMRAQAWVYTSGKVDVFSRNGKEITSVSDKLKRQLLDFAAQPSLAWPDDVMIIEGEIEAGENFNEAISSARKKEQQDNLIFTIFDILTQDEFNGLSQTSLADRVERRNKAKIDELHPDLRMITHKVVINTEEVVEAYNDARARGKEGIIVKDMHFPYEPKRSYGWLKVKGEETEDAPIVAIEPGKIGTKYEGLIGAFIVRRENGVEVNVGSGLSDELRKTDGEQYVGKMIEIEYHEETPDGSLRHPRFVKFRPDKDVA